MTFAERAPSRQITGAAAVLAIHAALILALTSGLAIRPTISLPTPIELVTVAPAKPAAPVPVDNPDVLDSETTTVDVFPPHIDVELEPVHDIIVAHPVERTFQDADDGGTMSTRPLSLRSDPRHPLTPPDYPASEIRRNHEGTVQLLIYVLPDGRVGDVKISRSSGYPLLDIAAMRKASSAWRFLPATSGSGQAIAAWGAFDVKFELR